MKLKWTDKFLCPCCNKDVALAYTDGGYVLSCGTHFLVGTPQSFEHRCTDGHPVGCLCAKCRSESFGVTHF